MGELLQTGVYTNRGATFYTHVYKMCHFDLTPPRGRYPTKKAHVYLRRVYNALYVVSLVLQPQRGGMVGGTLLQARGCGADVQASP